MSNSQVQRGNIAHSRKSERFNTISQSEIISSDKSRLEYSLDNRLRLTSAFSTTTCGGARFLQDRNQKISGDKIAGVQNIDRHLEEQYKHSRVRNTSNCIVSKYEQLYFLNGLGLKRRHPYLQLYKLGVCSAKSRKFSGTQFKRQRQTNR